MDYHDVLATVGAGSAHPGGYQTTLEWLDHAHIQPTDSVLDVGCGTGRTLTAIQRKFGCSITGVDIRPAMIRKAKRRCATLGLSGTWRVGSAEKIPFPDNTFDLVITESVNVFIDVQLALRSYYRVLKKNGQYIDVEMMLMGPAPPDFHSTALQMYGARQVPDLRSWRQLYRQAGFTHVTVLSTHPVRPMDSALSDQMHPDEVQLEDRNAYQNPRVLQVLRQNSSWLDRYQSSLGYGIFVCRKTE